MPHISESDKCSMCGGTDKIVPKAGSGVTSHMICLECVDRQGIEILPEYRENIKEFGHWWRGKN